MQQKNRQNTNKKNYLITTAIFMTCNRTQIETIDIKWTLTMTILLFWFIYKINAVITTQCQYICFSKWISMCHFIKLRYIYLSRIFIDFDRLMYKELFLLYFSVYTYFEIPMCKVYLPYDVIFVFPCTHYCVNSRNIKDCFERHNTVF